MEISINKSFVSVLLFDIAAILFIYCVPPISHLLSFPLYLFEPMRIVVFLSLAHFRKSNAYIIALTLPLFSFIISGHPVPLKVFLITLELVLNVYLFFALTSKFKNIYLASFLSIILSKTIYYCLKYAFIALVLFEGSLVSTPIYIQFIVTAFLGLYVAIILKKKVLKE